MTLLVMFSPTTMVIMWNGWGHFLSVVNAKWNLAYDECYTCISSLKCQNHFYMCVIAFIGSYFVFLSIALVLVYYLWRYIFLTENCCIMVTIFMFYHLCVEI